MDTAEGTLQTLAKHLVLALEPLKAGVADMAGFRTLLYRLAWEVNSLPPEYTALAAKVDAAVTALEGLGDDPPPAKIFDVFDKVMALHAAVRAITTAPDGVDPTTFFEEIGLALFDLLLVDYLIQEFPGVHSALRALGIIKEEFTVATSTRPSILLSRFQWDEIPKVLSDPGSIPERVYGWGTDDFNFPPIAGYLLQFFLALNWPAYIARINDPTGKGFLEAPVDPTMSIDWELKLPVLKDNILGNEIEVGLALMKLPPQNGKPAGLILQPLVPQELGENYILRENLKLDLRAGTDVASTFGIVLLPPDDISVKYPGHDGTPLPDAGFGVTLTYAPPTAAMLLGSPGKSRLEMKGAATSFNLGFINGQLELQFQATPQNLQMVICAADLDGFLGQLLGSGEKTIPITLAAQWSNRTGFNFTGGAGLEVSTHPHWSLGPLRIDRLDLGIKSTFDTGHPPDLKAEVTTALSGVLGPVTFSADGIGVSLALGFSEGNAGPFDIQYGFTPPHGLGILVDAGPIAGGGFLSFEPEKGRYSGALELSVFSTCVKAIGFLETKLPDGTPGYSFVILVSAEFAAIQLGLGFTLNGVGGLAALHRALASDALQAGLRNGSVDDLLFPKDPIANAPRIISDLSTIFPPAQGHYVFGPMALIGWGTPTLVEAKLGIVLELPSPVRLTLLGLITAMLPSKEIAIVELHVAVLGRLDFASKLLSIDASLFDSKVAGFPLSGDMALRLEWGDQPCFVVSLGGLNPHFEPPADFPALKRLTINLSSGNNPRLTCQAYLALTSNTLQFGARAELYAAAAGFNVKGWVSFDCLIQRSPFSLLAELGADIAFRRGDSVLASVHLDASLTGPAPWHVWGEASLSLWLFDVSVDFDVTFGLWLPLDLPSIDPWPLLQEAIQDARNWTSTLAAGAYQVVTRRGATGPDVPQMIEPGGAATLRQNVLPLNRTITRFGAGKPVGPDHYAVDSGSVTMNGTPAPDVAAVTDYFAAAQFDDLNDTDKLSRPSFERMDAGIILAGDAVTAGIAVGVGVEFETIILDVPWQPRLGLRYILPLTHQLTMLQQGAAAQAPLKISGFAKFAPPLARPSLVTIDEKVYVVASMTDATLFPGITGVFGKGAALAALAGHLKAHPEDTGRLQVIPEHEAASTP